MGQNFSGELYHYNNECRHPIVPKPDPQPTPGMETRLMKKTGPYFRLSTAGQRRVLFEVWEETGSVREACRQARVSIRTFYYWKPRFEEGGYAAVEKPRSHAPRNPHRVPCETAKLIIEMKRTHPDWGKLRIAKEVVQLDDAVESISPNTVRRILEDAGLWTHSA